MFFDFVQRFFDNEFNRPNESKRLRGRRLQIESLENRELLSVNPLGWYDPNAEIVEITSTQDSSLPNTSEPEAALSPASANRLLTLDDLLPYATWYEVDGEKLWITSINATGKGLAGQLSLNLSGHSMLRTILLSENNLTSITLTNAGNLEWLEVAYNDLSSINNLAGCTSLDYLGLAGNQVKTLDVSNNNRLSKLTCCGNGMTNLKLSSSIVDLKCYWNNLKSLDMSTCPNLKNLECFEAGLNSLNVSGNTKLETLICYGNNLTTLDVSNNTLLTKLECYDNKLTALDVTKNTKLEYLWCNGNELTTLNVSQNTALKELYCANNKLKGLNTSQCTSLQTLNCNNNEIISLILPTGSTLTSLECRLNNLTFSSLPTSGNFQHFLYSDQAEIQIGTKSKEGVYVVPAGNKVDLSNQYSINGQTTTYEWRYEGGTAVEAGKITHQGGGVFLLDESLDQSRIYCEMKNLALPGLTLHTVVATVDSLSAVIESIHFEEKGNKYGVPVTCELVQLNAIINTAALSDYGYNIIGVTWKVINQDTLANKNDDSKNGREELSVTTLGGNYMTEYMPEAGAHGEKKVICEVLLEDETGQCFTISKEEDVKLFFRVTSFQSLYNYVTLPASMLSLDEYNDQTGKKGTADNPPNWFFYWKEDGAVPELSERNVVFDPELSGYGLLSPQVPWLDQVSLGSETGSHRYGKTILFPFLEPITFDGRSAGIDSVRQTLVHELEHRRLLFERWTLLDPPGGVDYRLPFDVRQGLADSYGHDLGSEQEKEFLTLYLYINTDAYRSNGDLLANFMEDSYGTWTIITDTWNMNSIGDYLDYGDNEYLARLAGDKALSGISEKDWSNIGEMAKDVMRKAGRLPTVKTVQISAQGMADSTQMPAITTNSYVTASTTQQISPFGSSIFSTSVGNYSDQAVTLSGGTKADELVVTTTITVETPGTYSIDAELFDAEEGCIGCIFQKLELVAGMQTVELHFDGRKIGARAANGMFELDLRLYDSNMNIIDGGVAVHTTQEYHAADFKQLLDVAVTAEQTLDANANSLYDTLRVQTQITAPAAGTYNLGGYLYSSTGELVTYVSFSKNLVEGLNEIDFDFDGHSIFLSGFDGPYTFALGSFIDRDATVFSDDNLYQTAAYFRTQFEGAQAALNGSFDKGFADSDNDGNIDTLTVDIGLSVVLAGQYEVIAYLNDASGNYGAYASSVASLAAGSQTVTLDFASEFLVPGALDGSWTLSTLMLRHTAGETMLVYAKDAYTFEIEGTNTVTPPENIFVTGGTDTSVTLSWDPVKVATGYTVQRYKGSGDISDPANWIRLLLPQPLIPSPD